MNPRFFIILAWLFYLAQQSASDPLWLFCIAYSIILAVCTYFYERENPRAGGKRKNAPKPASSRK